MLSPARLPTSSPHSADVLLAAWRSWHDAVGPATRAPFERYVNLSNVGARDHNFSDAGALWRSGYEPLSASEFAAQVDAMWLTVRPLYRALVRGTSALPSLLPAAFLSRSSRAAHTSRRC